MKINHHILFSGTSVVPFTLEHNNDTKIIYLPIAYSTIINWYFTDWDILKSDGIKTTELIGKMCHIMLPKRIACPDMDVYISGFLAPKSRIAFEYENI